MGKSFRGYTDRRTRLSIVAECLQRYKFDFKKDVELYQNMAMKMRQKNIIKKNNMKVQGYDLSQLQQLLKLPQSVSKIQDIKSKGSNKQSKLTSNLQQNNCKTNRPDIDVSNKFQPSHHKSNCQIKLSEKPQIQGLFAMFIYQLINKPIKQQQVSNPKQFQISQRQQQSQEFLVQHKNKFRCFQQKQLGFPKQQLSESAAKHFALPLDKIICQFYTSSASQFKSINKDAKQPYRWEKIS